MSGGKGGSTTSQVQIPEYIEAAAQRNLNKAERISQLGYVPYYGPDVAALTPMQQASMRNVADTAGAFGLQTTAGQDVYGMPEPTTYAGGVQGYSSAPMFEQAQAELARRRPAQKSYIDSFFIDPFSGAYGSNVQAPIDYTGYATGAQQQRNQNAFELAMSGGAAGSALSQADFNRNVGVIGDVIGDPSYDGTRVLTPSERFLVSESPAAQMAQDTIYMNQLAGQARGLRDVPAALMGRDPSFENPSSRGSYGGSLVTGGLSGSFSPIGGITGKIIDKGVSTFAPNYARDKQTEQLAKAYGSTPKDDGGYNFAFTPATTPTNTALAEKVAGFQTYTPTVGMPTATSTPVTNGPVSTTTSTRGSSPRPVLRPSSSGGGGGTPVKTTSSGATVIPRGTTIARGTVLNSKSDPVVNVGGKLYNQSKAPAAAPAPKPKSSGGSSSSSSSSGSKKSKTVMCTAYCEMGYLSKDIWNLDRRYGVMMYRNDPNLIEGYHIWATPIADYIRGQSIGAKTLRAIMWPIVKAWAEEMAHNMKPEEYKPNYFGKLIKFVGEPFSRMCGKLKPRKVEGVA